MGETSQGKIRNNPEASSKAEIFSIIDAAQKFFRDRTARLPAVSNHMNAPCKQLRSKKVPHCAWSIRRDIGQHLRMLKTFHNGSYDAPLARGQVLESARACLFMSFSNFCTEELASNLCRGLISISVEWRKRLYFCQITLFIVFFSFARARDIWPINN